MINEKFSYSITEKDGQARTGIISTRHGQIKTPAFIAVGTKATVKSLSNEQLDGTGMQAALANTYHLMLRPGSEVVKKSGGLHRFMNYKKPLFTDSGGFQVFSLGVAFDSGITKVAEAGESREGIPKNSARFKIDDDGVSFKSHLDGSKIYLDPEKSMQIQYDLGADIIFAFDECTAPTAPKDYQKLAMDRTHVWAERSLNTHKKLDTNNKQALFGVVQGGRHEDLRRESARTLAAMNFDGFGIGGAFNKHDLGEAVGWVTDELPDNKPRHLLGIGTPEDILAAVAVGIDTFDCVTPTRNARNGSLYTYDGRFNIGKKDFEVDESPIEQGCSCYTCSNHGKNYLRHLYKSGELASNSLLTIHNLSFFARFMNDIRGAIASQDLQHFSQNWLANYHRKVA